jgi:hypothetical protein
MHTPDTSIPEAEAQGRRLGDSSGPSSSAFMSSTVWHGAEQHVVLVQLEGASRELEQAGGKGEKKCAARGRSGGGH